MLSHLQQQPPPPPQPLQQSAPLQQSQVLQQSSDLQQSQELQSVHLPQPESQHDLQGAQMSLHTEPH